MSMHYWLICEGSGELVEVVAHVGNSNVPRIEPNVLGAFLLYHNMAYPGTTFTIRYIDSVSDDIDIYDSEEERAEWGKKSDFITWKADNYHKLVSRNPNAAAGIASIEKSFTWVRS